MFSQFKIHNSICMVLSKIFKKFARQYEDPLYRNSYYLMANSFNSAVTGFIFWIIVARLYDAQSVGLAIVVISASTTIVNISGLGIGTSIIRFMHNEEDKIDLINTGLTIVGITSIISSIIFIVGLSFWERKLDIVLSSPLYIIIFIFFTTISVLSSTFLNIYIAERDAKYFFFQNAISDITRLFFPFILLKLFTIFGVFGSLGISNTIGFIISILYFSKSVIPQYKIYLKIQIDLLKRIKNFSMGNYLVNLLSSAPSLLLPFLILHFLAPEDNAYFYVAFSIANLLFIMPSSLSTSLFAEGSFKEDAFILNLRKAIIQAYVFVFIAITMIILFGGKILLLFGPAYSINSYLLLSIFAVSSIFLTLNSFYTTYLKITLRTKELILLNICLSISILTLSYFFIQIPVLNINGVGIAYLLAQGTISLYIVIKFISSKSKIRADPTAIYFESRPINTRGINRD